MFRLAKSLTAITACIIFIQKESSSRDSYTSRSIFLLLLTGMGGVKGLRIGIAVPNGPEAGLAVLTAMCYGQSIHL
jgi:hypothetical protein